MTAISKITAMGRTTVPRKVRLALKSEPGVMLAWDMEPDGRVAVRRIQPMDIEYLKAVQDSLCEWHTVDDEREYGKL